MTTNNTAANTTTIPDSWGDLYKLDQPLDFEAFLNSDILATRRNQNKTYDIIYHTTGSVSTIASTCLAVHILRSNHGLSTTYHRLVFGLSVGDILSSFGFALGSTMVPKDMNYFVPGAQGNMTTCTVQGFLYTLGVNIVAVYNCSICLYYLAIIRYNKNDEYIRNKLEPWFHGIAIVIPLVCGFIFIAMKGYNGNEPVCSIRPNDPPHCIGYESGDTPVGFNIPCGRGDGGENPILYLVTLIVGFGSLLIITPTVIVVTMLPMYMSVSKIEKRMRNYGVSTLRLDARSGRGGSRGENTTGTNNITPCGANDQHDGVMRRVKRSVLMCMIPPCLHSRDGQPRPTSRSNRATSHQKRAILHMAAGYSFAWALVWIPFTILHFLPKSYATFILFACLTPLQGLFNLLVFMSPKVRNAKRPRRGENLTWRRASINAYMSKGEMRRMGGDLSSGNARTAGRNSMVLSSLKSVVSLPQRVQRSLKSLLLRTRSTGDTRSNVAESDACTTKNDQSSTNPRQVRAPGADKLTSSNPHLANDMKDAEGNDTMRPHQQEEFLATDGDEEEKCEEQNASYHLG
jgi:hypothetical protein